ncbi:hypothetical protein J6590_006786 [Homalodisca vitripennis]|nr:hypothetical protein J6590_006786 [Homalodisca vitripennis]
MSNGSSRAVVYTLKAIKDYYLLLVPRWECSNPSSAERWCTEESVHVGYKYTRNVLRARAGNCKRPELIKAEGYQKPVPVLERG